MVYKWLKHWTAAGEAGLANRGSRPHRMHWRHQIERLRRQGWSTRPIAWGLTVSLSTVRPECRRQHVGRLKKLQPADRGGVLAVLRLF